jgi:hypothetical protein
MPLTGTPQPELFDGDRTLPVTSIDDGVPPNMVQRVMGHERSSTTMDLYTRRTDNADRILEALTDEGDEDSGGDGAGETGDGPAGPVVPV